MNTVFKLVFNCSIITMSNIKGKRREKRENNEKPPVAKSEVMSNKFSGFFTVTGYNLGKLIIEGKTKAVFDLPDEPGNCILVSKDRITAGDGVKAHNLAGKSVISNKTAGKVFEILNTVGTYINNVKTRFKRINTQV